MRNLKCTTCGSPLKIAVTDEAMAIGTCSHCGAEYLLDRQRKQYVVVEHRFAENAARVTAPEPQSKQRLFLVLTVGLAALFVIAGLLISLFLKGPGTVTPAAGSGAHVVFNVASEGSSPGQFRDNPSQIAIDARGQAVVTDLNQRIYVFGPDGGFIANHPKPKDYNDFVTVLPDGGLILLDGWPGGFVRYDPVTGQMAKPVKAAQDDDFRRAYIAGAVTPDGGFAVYATLKDDHDSDSDLDPSLPLRDAVILYGSDLRERRRLTGLLAQAIAVDPMVQTRPRVSSMTINGAGNIFLSMLADEDSDSRGGVYEFNADGVFQRRMEIEQTFWGDLAAGPDGSVWYADPWRSDLQRATGAGVQRIDLSTLARDAGRDIGNVVGIATYPNGDVGVITNNHHLVRIALDPE